MSLHPFYIGRDRGSARVTNFPEVTQVAGGGAGFQMQKGISGACPCAVTHSSMSPGLRRTPRSPLTFSVLSTASETDTGHFPSSGRDRRFPLEGVAMHTSVGCDGVSPAHPEARQRPAKV